MTEREKFEKWLNTFDRQTLVTMTAKQARTIEELQAATKAAAPQWIPVSERLPDSDDEVLVYPFPDNSYGIRLGTYHPYEGKLKGKWTYEEERHSYYEQVEINNVTHWMPLPAAPVKDGV